MTTYAIRRAARRFLGFQYAERGFVKFRWMEMSFRPGLAFELCHFDDDDDIGHYSLRLQPGWPNIYLTLPFKPKRGPSDQMLDSWGFSLDSDTWATVHTHWGSRTKLIDLPWAWGSCVKHDVQLPDGSWAPWKPDYRGEHDGRKVETFPYRYVLKSGEVQDRTATVYVQRMEWRWAVSRMLGLPWPRWIITSISVEFNDEVGERTGSWKGGTIGCGYNMRPGETAEQCLRRMERERKFT